MTACTRRAVLARAAEYLEGLEEYTGPVPLRLPGGRRSCSPVAQCRALVALAAHDARLAEITPSHRTQGRNWDQMLEADLAHLQELLGAMDRAGAKASRSRQEGARVRAPWLPAGLRRCIPLAIGLVLYAALTLLDAPAPGPATVREMVGGDPGRADVRIVDLLWRSPGPGGPDLASLSLIEEAE